jgi:hypothetical protein
MATEAVAGQDRLHILVEVEIAMGARSYLTRLLAVAASDRG